MSIELKNMELSPKQQIIELIKGASHILVVTHNHPDSDAVGSALALKMALNQLEKKVTVAAANCDYQTYHFLPEVNEIQNQLDANRDLVISIDTRQSSVAKIMYQQTEDQHLNIYVTPDKNSVIDPAQLNFATGQYAWDLIVILDCSEIERLGDIYAQNPDLFYSVPVINIDHHPSNDHYGKVNLIDLTATSTAEMLVPILESLGREKNLLDEKTATCLLAGIVGDTASFQNGNTTPKSFTVAAQLVAAGAHQQEIIHNLFRTRTLSTLKLWGLILTNVIEESDFRFVWSSASAEQIASVGAEPGQTSNVIDELLKTTVGSDFALLISERDGAVHGSLRSINKTVDVSAIATLFGGGGHAVAAAFDIPNTTLAESQKKIIEKVKQWQKQRSN